MFATVILITCIGVGGYLAFAGDFVSALILLLLGFTYVQAHNAYVTAELVRNILLRGKYQPPEDEDG